MAFSPIQTRGKLDNRRRRGTRIFFLSAFGQNDDENGGSQECLPHLHIRFLNRSTCQCTGAENSIWYTKREQCMDLAEFHDDVVISETASCRFRARRARRPAGGCGGLAAGKRDSRRRVSPARRDGQIRCRLTSGHRTEGMSEDDGYQFNAIVSRRGGNIWEGWREFRFPGECFYTQGIPCGMEGDAIGNDGRARGQPVSQRSPCGEGGNARSADDG